LLGFSIPGTEPAQATVNGPAMPQQRGKKTTKASIKLAALNIRGNGNMNINHNDNKWWRLNQIICHERIGILIVREAHLDEEQLESINSVYRRQLLVHLSRDPNTPNANGVAIVINKGQLKTDNIITREIIPGRAMILKTKQHDGTPLSILGVYAPNAPGENADFWTAIQQWFESHPPGVPVVYLTEVPATAAQGRVQEGEGGRAGHVG
jgi:hypothetical protein